MRERRAMMCRASDEREPDAARCPRHYARRLSRLLMIRAMPFARYAEDMLPRYIASVYEHDMRLMMMRAV